MKIEVEPHKFGNYWIKMYDGEVGSHFYASHDRTVEIMTKLQTESNKIINQLMNGEL